MSLLVQTRKKCEESLGIMVTQILGIIIAKDLAFLQVISTSRFSRSLPCKVVVRKITAPKY